MSILDVLSLDSGNRNIFQQTGATNSTAQGYFQITNTNWGNIAPRLGISAPNALSATPFEQASVAADLFNNSGGASNWGVGRSWGLQSIKNFFSANPGGYISSGDISNFAASHGDYSGGGPATAAMSASDPLIDPFATGSIGNQGLPNANTDTFAAIPNTSLGNIPGFDNTSPGFVAAPDGSGFSSGLTPGVLGQTASDINIPGTDLGVGTTLLGTNQITLSGDAITSGVQGAIAGATGATDAIAKGAATTSKLIPNFFSDVVIFFQRAAVILLGLILIALAAAALVRHNSLLPTVGKGARGL